MTKPFFEVFPTLDIKGALHDKLEQAGVERVSASKQRDRLNIYLYSTRLILKEDIWAAEAEIKNQLFADAAIVVHIFERYELSSQYTPENLMGIYRESILEELKRYSHIEYNAFRTAELSYPEPERLLLTVDDTVLNRGKEPELTRILEKIMVERCGLRCGISVAYREAETGKYAADDELKIQMRVNEIYRRARKDGRPEQEDSHGEGYKAVDGKGSGTGDGALQAADGQPYAQASGKAQEGAVSQNAANAQAGKEKAAGYRAGGAGKAASSGSTGAFQGKGEFRRSEFHKGEFRRNEFRKGDYTRTLKQSENPDVIYGRDFEDETMPIEDIVGEIGEVTIRGRVLKFDSRELRNGEKSLISVDVTDFSDTITIKLFARNEFVDELKGRLKAGSFVDRKSVV